MKIIRKDDAKANQGKTFTGEATLTEMVVPQDTGDVKVTVVRFENGSVTHWHIHPGEQILYVLEGECRVGNETEEYVVHAGDVVHTPPGEKHWHGATPGTTMAHISITTVGSPKWLEAPQLDQ